MLLIYSQVPKYPEKWTHDCLDKIRRAPLGSSDFTDTFLPLLDSIRESVHPRLPLLLPLCQCPYLLSFTISAHSRPLCFSPSSLSTHSFLFISSSQPVSIHPQSLPKCSVEGRQQNKIKKKERNRDSMKTTGFTLLLQMISAFICERKH